eukprot:EG_transcript_12197
MRLWVLACHTPWRLADLKQQSPNCSTVDSTNAVPRDRAVSGPVTCTSWQFMGDPSYFVRMTYTLCVMSTTPRLFLCCLYFYRSPPPGFPDPQHKSPAHSQIATFKATLPRLRFTTRTTCVKCVPHTTLHTLCVTTGLQWSRVPSPNPTGNAQLSLPSAHPQPNFFVHPLLAPPQSAWMALASPSPLTFTAASLPFPFLRGFFSHFDSFSIKKMPGMQYSLISVRRKTVDVAVLVFKFDALLTK